MPKTTQKTTPAPRLLWKIECAPECGFSARDHDQEELGEFAIRHAKKHHGRAFTFEDVHGMMRPA